MPSLTSTTRDAHSSAVCRWSGMIWNLGDSFQSLDLRLTKTFRFSENFNIQAIGEVFNCSMSRTFVV